MNAHIGLWRSSKGAGSTRTSASERDPSLWAITRPCGTTACMHNRCIDYLSISIYLSIYL